MTPDLAEEARPRFELTPSIDELAALPDPAADAALWRTIACIALSHCATAKAQLQRRGAPTRESRDDVR